MKKIKITVLILSLLLNATLIFLIITDYNYNRGVVEKTIRIIENYGLEPLSEKEKDSLIRAVFRKMEWELRKNDKYAKIKIENPSKQSRPKNKKVAPVQIPIKTLQFHQGLKQIHYIKIDNFRKDISGQVEKILRNMILPKPTPNKHNVIIDLRNNPGGNAEYTRQVLDLFLPKGKKTLILKQTGSKINPKSNSYETKRSAIFKKEIKLFVLVNRNTASGAEVFSDVIQRYERGIVIGTRTYGKNSMQHTKEIQKGINVQVTTGEFEYMSGGDHIIPDIKIGKYEDALEVTKQIIFDN